MTFLDVGQGDCTLIHLQNNKGNILIDTGGNYYYDLSINIINYLKSEGIKKIDELILTHGDFDHMGAAINLINNFKVNKVIFNNGEYNELELKLIKILEQKNISYYKDNKTTDIENKKLYFLNSTIYKDENDNSNVIYIKFNRIKLLMMGDASIKVEEQLLKKYNLNDIDILRVGHHGSKNSSSQKFIDTINPKYSIISVGKNNRYNHPNEDVLETLKNSKIYRTDKYGSIKFKFKYNKLQIETCMP